MSRPVILCVDDEKVVLQSLKAQIKECFGNSYSYELAENAEDALELVDELAEEEVSLIIIVSDWLMPGMRGDELLIQIHQRFPQTIKILLTGQADEEAIQRAFEQANLHRCLRKPWSEKELIETIQSGIAALSP